MDELIYASATWLAQAIRDKEVSSQEVVEVYLRRIGEVNPKLNAVLSSLQETEHLPRRAKPMKPKLVALSQDHFTAYP